MYVYKRGKKQILIYEGNRTSISYVLLCLAVDLTRRNWNTTLLQDKGIKTHKREK